MDTLPSHAQNGNTPQKKCTGPCGRTLPATTEFFYQNGKVLYSQCKQCKSKKTKDHNALPEVRDRIKERNQALWQRSRTDPELREKINQSQRSHRQDPDNREKKRRYLQEYRTRPESRDRQQEWTRNYRAIPEVRDRSNERERRYYRTRPEKRQQVRNRVNNRTARRKAATGTHTLQQVKEQYDRQKGKCYYCRCAVEWGKHHVDHVVPLSRGGSNDISNLVIACPTCNLRKNAKLPHEWPEGGRLL